MKKSILIGIAIYIFGYFLSTLFASILSGDYAEYSYFYAIVFSTLYLSAIVGISVSLILKELKNSNKK